MLAGAGGHASLLRAMDCVASLLRLLDDQAHGDFPAQRAGDSDDATNADVTWASLGKLD